MTDIWTYLSHVNKPILMYGTGNGADKILDVCESLSISIKEIFTSDEFFRPKEFRGYSLKPLSEIRKEYTDCIILLAFAVFRDDMLSLIKELSKTYEVLAPEVPVFGEDYFCSRTQKQFAREIELLPELLADKKSVEVFNDIMRYRITGVPEYLFNCQTERQEAFENIINLDENEYYVDLGAYRGDTIEEFLLITGGKYKRITALEPDVKNFNKLAEYVNDKKLSDTTIHNKASWNKAEVLSFDGGGGRSSAVGEGKQAVQGIDLDTLLFEAMQTGDMPTYVKMDVEGAEEKTLLGMKNLLKTAKPKLSVSAYHKTGDLFTLPFLIKELNPDYKIFLRHHPYIPDWDTNLYCV